jgi:5'-nucleotidase
MAAALAVAACSNDKAAAPSPGGSSAGTLSASASRPLRILVSNDDGVDAPGLDALVQALTAEPDVVVTVVAPAQNQSGTGGKTSPGTVPASEAKTHGGYPAVAVQGFPADAVIRGLTLAKERPDVVITGTNAGQNLGPFIDISGTIGAARAAAQQGIPALAVSAGLGDSIDFATATADAVQWVRDHRAALTASNRPAATVDNLNAPTCPTGHVRGVAQVTPDTGAPQADALAAPDCTSTSPQPSTDVAAFHAGFATLSTVPVPVPPNGG